MTISCIPLLDPEYATGVEVVRGSRGIVIAGLQVNRSSDWTCTWGMSQNKIHLINPGFPRAQCSLTWQHHGLKHLSFGAS